MTRQSSQAPLGSVRPCGIPTTAFLLKYQDGGAFADCYVVRVEGAVTQSGFVKAFYTTRLFKIERTLLEWVAKKPRPMRTRSAWLMAARPPFLHGAWKSRGQINCCWLTSPGARALG